MPAKTVSVAVVRRGNDCVVVPPSVVLEQGDSIRWVNVTGSPATVLFPHANVFGANAFSARMDNTNNNKHAPANPAGNVTQQFPYRIFCEATNAFALGNSDPEIIVG